MSKTGTTDAGASWGDEVVAPGEERSLSINVSESYSGGAVTIPLFVWRGEGDGPTVFVSAAVHGDEINGTGAIRYIIAQRPFRIVAGTLVLVPVINMPGFERHSRYLPDRRDLNRCFPGLENGSLSSRMAHSIFNQVIRRCDYGIDLHTAAVRRTNYPNVRADMGNPELAAFARAFGSELIVSGVGPKGSLRRSACKAGCPTLILEAGEVWKVEPTVVEYAVRGVRNCLAFLGMVNEKPVEPPFQVETDTSKWVRARQGGFLRFHVTPGQIVSADEPLATNTSLTGEEQNIIVAPRAGIVLGMTTLPSVAPGDPICHLAYSKKGTLRKVRKGREELDDDSLQERLLGDLSRSLMITDSEGQ